MKVIKKLLLTIVFLGLLSACGNYFHDLIPPDDNRILSFEIDGQIDNSIITNNSITVTIDTITDIHSLIPRVEISRKAVIIPVTLNYIYAAFPGIDIVKTAIDLYTTADLTRYVWDLIEDTPDFNIPALDIPIDFSTTVNFLVVSGQGSIRQYAVNVEVDSGLPHLFSFGFYKHDNPELIHDAVTLVNKNAKSIYSAVLYPAEMDFLTYELIPIYEIHGDKVEVDGEEIKSGIDAIRFNKTTGIQHKTVTVWRDGNALDFTFTAVFTEDPDSVRSITDFRFNRINNNNIYVNAVASIINNDALGTINIQVFYSGAKPAFLTPHFISPGTVSVGGITQTTGSNTHDFSSPVFYRVVSRNNRFVRTYTVFVDFVDITSASPVINNFKFSSALNHELTEDSQATISDASGHIMITVKYRGINAPDSLTAEFSATGIVRVFSAVQTSGFSAQNFYRQVKYTVTNPENSLFTRDYWVQVTFVRDTSSDASITSFSFHPDENAGLNEELNGRIDNASGRITIFAPIGSGITSRTMYPRFSAAGQVSVNGAIQTNGNSGQHFNTPVIYRVVSANGINAREYTVTVRELRSTIYVDLNAHGESDGTSWKDAFRDLKDACEAASLFAQDVPKEIWIAKGTYKPSADRNREEYFLLTPNTSYLGGFSGNETIKSERNAAGNPVIINGDLGGGVYSMQLFANFNIDNTTQIINGDIIFDNISFVNARYEGYITRYGGGAIGVEQTSGKNLRVTNCTFNNFQNANGAAIYARGGGDVYIDNSNFSTCSSYDLTGVIFTTVSGITEIKNVKISSVSRGSAVTNFNGTLKISDSEFIDIADQYAVYSNRGLTADSLSIQNSLNGIWITGGALNLSNANFNNIYTGVWFDSFNGRAVIENSIFNNCFLGVGIGSSSSIDLSEIIVTNVNGSNGLRLYSSGRVDIQNIKIENVKRGMLIVTDDSVIISDARIKNAKTEDEDFGGGISISRARSLEITNSIIEDTEAFWGGGIYFLPWEAATISITGVEFNNLSAKQGGAISILSANALTVNISHCYFNNTKSTDNASNLGGRGGAIYFDANVLGSINNCTFSNTSSVGRGGAISTQGLYFDLSISNCTFLNTVSYFGSGNAISIISNGLNASIFSSILLNNNFSGIPNPLYMPIP